MTNAAGHTPNTVRSEGYERSTDEHGQVLVLVGDTYVTEEEAEEYAAAEADALKALGDDDDKS